MKDKLYIPEQSETKHKKKSTAKGRARADHKHQYETVLLNRVIKNTDMWGNDRVSDFWLPTKLCTVCGRIKGTDEDDSYYILERRNGYGFFRSFGDRKLSEKALKLSRWHTEDWWDSYATREENN